MCHWKRSRGDKPRIRSVPDRCIRRGRSVASNRKRKKKPHGRRDHGCGPAHAKEHERLRRQILLKARKDRRDYIDKRIGRLMGTKIRDKIRQKYLGRSVGNTGYYQDPHDVVFLLGMIEGWKMRGRVQKEEART